MTNDAVPVFTPDEVVALASHQSAGQFHPFTCPNRGDGQHRDVFGDLGALVPTVHGWVCPFCDYTQDWAHSFMKSAPIPSVSAPPVAPETVKEAVTLAALHEANIKRQAIWCPDELPDLSFRGNELSGEVGEACNVIKKLERERHNWRGSRDTVEHLAEELADVVICADLCAITAGIDLSAAVVAKFNATSDKVGIDVKLGL